MKTQIFINLPVESVVQSRGFFGKLGFTFNERFCSDDTACVVLDDDKFVMLLERERFASFTPKVIVDAATSTEVLIAILCDSREHVERLCNIAFENGGRRYKDSDDQGFMFSWGFEDPDGHIWEPFWMDHAAATS